MPLNIDLSTQHIAVQLQQAIKTAIATHFLGQRRHTYLYRIGAR